MSSLCFEAANLILCDAARQRVQLANDQRVRVEAGRIVELGSRSSVRIQTGDDHIVLPASGVLMPGLVNAHSHAAMSLLRGIADDTPLQPWLTDHIWPREAQHVSEAFVFDGALLAAYEMLRGGVTTCNDMYFFPRATIRAFAQAGLRALIGAPVFEFPSAYGSGADDYLAKAIELVDTERDNPLIKVSLAPHAPYTVSDQSFRRIASIAEEAGLLVQTHLAETADEVVTSIKDHGKRPLARLNDLGITGTEFLAIHGVHLNDAELEVLALQGAKLAHCPSSNLKLASGIAPISRAVELGLSLGFGTDSAASNNRLDLWREMGLASLLAKNHPPNASALSAAQALFHATQGGADALGWGNAIGSIAVGKWADLIAVDLGALDHQPVFDIPSHLVNVVDRSAVTDVWIAGSKVVSKGVPTRFDADALRRRVTDWHGKLKA